MKRYIPESKYKKAKSTDGTEFVEIVSKKKYKGFYIEDYKGKFYGGKTPEENGPELKKILRIPFAIPITLLGLFAGVFKKKPTQSERDKGVVKRNFIQDKYNNKIVETDPDTYEQAKKTLVNNIFAEVNWIIQGPAEDTMFGKYPYEGAESRNKKTIQALEKTMPGISTFITDYKYLVEEPVVVEPQDTTSETFIEKDLDVQLANDRKANFDTRK
jgi:hypothetical protein